MRELATEKISAAVAAMCQRANFVLGEDMVHQLRRNMERESNPVAKRALGRILENAEVAETKSIPMCQDTGMAVIFADVGQDLHITGGLLRDAINEGVRQGYSEGYLRASVTEDPVHRKNTGDNTPAMLHTELVSGNRLALRLLAKGGGGAKI